MNQCYEKDELDAAYRAGYVDGNAAAMTRIAELEAHVTALGFKPGEDHPPHGEDVEMLVDGFWHDRVGWTNDFNERFGPKGWRRPPPTGPA